MTPHVGLRILRRPHFIFNLTQRVQSVICKVFLVVGVIQPASNLRRNRISLDNDTTELCCYFDRNIITTVYARSDQRVLFVFRGRNHVKNKSTIVVLFMSYTPACNNVVIEKSKIQKAKAKSQIGINQLCDLHLCILIQFFAVLSFSLGLHEPSRKLAMQIARTNTRRF